MHEEDGGDNDDNHGEVQVSPPSSFVWAVFWDGDDDDDDINGDDNDDNQRDDADDENEIIEM